MQFTAHNGNAHVLGSIMLLRTCKLSIQQSEKRCSPMSFSFLPSRNIMGGSDLGSLRAQLFLRVRLVSQQGVDFSDDLRGHLS